MSGNDRKIFEKLKKKRESETPRLDPRKVVKNLSSRDLNDEQIEALSLGLKLAFTPKQIPYHNIIAAMEAICKQLNNEGAKALREGVSKALHMAKPPKCNINKQLNQSITELRKDSTIVFLPVDKGKTLQWSWIEVNMRTK